MAMAFNPPRKGPFELPYVIWHIDIAKWLYQYGKFFNAFYNKVCSMHYVYNRLVEVDFQLNREVSRYAIEMIGSLQPITV